MKLTPPPNSRSVHALPSLHALCISSTGDEFRICHLSDLYAGQEWREGVVTALHDGSLGFSDGSILTLPDRHSDSEEVSPRSTVPAPLLDSEIAGFCPPWTVARDGACSNGTVVIPPTGDRVLGILERDSVVVISYDTGIKAWNTISGLPVGVDSPGDIPQVQNCLQSGALQLAHLIPAPARPALEFLASNHPRESVGMIASLLLSDEWTPEPACPMDLSELALLALDEPPVISDAAVKLVDFHLAPFLPRRSLSTPSSPVDISALPDLPLGLTDERLAVVHARLGMTVLVEPFLISNKIEERTKIRLASFCRHPTEALVKFLIAHAAASEPSRAALVRLSGARLTAILVQFLTTCAESARAQLVPVISMLAKKKPIGLYPAIPSILHHVILWLSPSDRDARAALLGKATNLLAVLVQAYPTVSFNAHVQSLAVAATDGSVTLYDVRAAVRLIVIRAHEGQASACSISPDGTRLVSISLADEKLRVWRMPPGTVLGALNPFTGQRLVRELPFSLGLESQMTTQAQVEWIVFQWKDSRVRCSIRETVLGLTV